MQAERPEADSRSPRLVPRSRRHPLLTARLAAQGAFAFFSLYTGWQFFLFVASVESGGAVPSVPRPAAVEAFLPISALVALRSWVGTGLFDTVHPAGLVIFLGIVATSVLLKKGFCAWICPVGAISDWLARLGRRIFGRNLRMPSYLDWPLRGIKYLLLASFIALIGLGMSALQASTFLRTPYNMVADVKMLQFFTDLSPAVEAFLLALAMMSMLFSNFWCRYLCPYGALLGLVSLASPLKVARDPSRCTDCGLCTRACPNRIDVARLDRVHSPECTACLECVAACRRKGALGIALPMGKPVLSAWLLPGLLLATFLGIMAVGQATGHWQTSITYYEYQRLIPIASSLTH